MDRGIIKKVIICLPACTLFFVLGFMAKEYPEKPFDEYFVSFDNWQTERKLTCSEIELYNEFYNAAASDAEYEEISPAPENSIMIIRHNKPRGSISHAKNEKLYIVKDNDRLTVYLSTPQNVNEVGGASYGCSDLTEALYEKLKANEGNVNTELTYLLSKHYVSRDDGVTFNEMTDDETEAFERFDKKIRSKDRFVYTEYTIDGTKQADIIEEKVKTNACLIAAGRNTVDYEEKAYYIYESGSGYEVCRYSNTYGDNVYVNPLNTDDMSNEIETLVKAFK